MKKIAIPLVLLAAAYSASAATVNFTAGEGYSDGMLKLHPDWNAQDQWMVSDSAGAGQISTTTGAFIRGNYTGVVSDNAIGSVFTSSITFSLAGLYGDGDTLPDASWKRTIISLGMNDQPAGSAPATDLGVDFRLNAGTYTNLELAVVGGSTIDLGPAGGYNSHTFLMTFALTKVTASTYDIAATIDSLDDAAGAFAASGTGITPVNGGGAAPGDFEGAAVVQGHFNAQPTSAPANGVAVYDGITINTFTADFVPEPSVFGLLGLGLAGMVVRRRR